MKILRPTHRLIFTVDVPARSEEQAEGIAHMLYREWLPLAHRYNAMLSPVASIHEYPFTANDEERAS